MRKRTATPAVGRLVAGLLVASLTGVWHNTTNDITRLSVAHRQDTAYVHGFVGDTSFNDWWDPPGTPEGGPFGPYGPQVRPG